MRNNDTASGWLLASVLWVPTLMLRSLFFMMLWGWYIVPVFHLPELRLVPAFGFVTVVQYMALNPLGAIDEDYRDMGIAQKMMFMNVYYFIVFLFGWLGHLFM